jgi:hypothetical protein
MKKSQFGCVLVLTGSVRFIPALLGTALVLDQGCRFTEPESYTRISGIVHDPSGAPAVGVLVSVHPGPPFAGQPGYAQTKTDNDGEYVLVARRLGPVALDLLTPGFSPPGPVSCILARDVQRNLAALRTFPGMPTNIDLKLEPGITLQGAVKDTRRAPVINALVDLHFGMFQLDTRPLRVDAQGAFCIPALPQGQDYNFGCGITAKGYGTAAGFPFPDSSNGNPHTLRGQDTRTNQYVFPAFVLKPADLRIAGEVVDGKKKPLAGAVVSASGPGQAQMTACAKTDSRGRFALNGLCEGPLHVWTVFTPPRGAPSRFLRLNGTVGVLVQAGETNLCFQLRETNY